MINALRFVSEVVEPSWFSSMEACFFRLLWPPVIVYILCVRCLFTVSGSEAERGEVGPHVRRRGGRDGGARAGHGRAERLTGTYENERSNDLLSAARTCVCMCYGCDVVARLDEISSMSILVFLSAPKTIDRHRRRQGYFQKRS